MFFKAVILLSFSITVTYCYRSYLYEPDDQFITTLNRYNFYREVFRKSNAFIVQFYASWCGHCIRFSTHFQKFSKEIVGWNSVVQLGVVNCADFTNVDLCAYFGVPGFPTIRFFAPFARKHNLGLNVDLHERTFEGLVEKCASLIRNYSDHHALPLEWPQLKAVKEISFDVVDDKRPVIVIAEKNDSSIGTEVILDLSSFDDYITVYRTIANASTTDSLPVVKRVFKSGKSKLVYSANSGNKSIMNAYETKKEIVRKIREVYLTDVWPLSSLDNKVNIASTTTKAPTVVKEYKVVAVDVSDLYNALHYTLYQEITLKKRLNTTQIEALHLFLIAVENHFPFRGSKGRLFIKEMISFIDSKMARKVIRMKELRERMRILEQQEPLPKPQPWKSCAGSLAHLRGYPCSLWLLFHTLTVSEHNKNIENSTVLYAIHGYVNHFYSCKYCVQHFNKMSANLSEQLSRFYERSPALWLWWAHNQVNTRLAGDESEDPSHPKLQFPPLSACSDCRSAGKSLKWNQKRVLDYLSNHYNFSSSHL